MNSGFQISKEIMVMHPKDNVAVCLHELVKGQRLSIQYDNKEYQLTILEQIPIGHKVSLAEIQTGGPILKYGEIIGKALKPIAIGEHIHVHNVTDY